MIWFVLIADLRHIDYNAKVAKRQQKYRVHCESGVTLGHICDAMQHLFEMHPAAKFVMVESIRCDTEALAVHNTPTTKNYLPGSSAEYAMEEQIRWAAERNAAIEEEAPRMKSWMPGMSAERMHEWQ